MLKCNKIKFIFKGGIIKNIYNLIEFKSSNFTKNDKFISKELINNPQLFLNSDINELSKKLYVSPSSISRFCQKIGVDGFKELKYILKNNINNINNKKEQNINENTYNKIYNYYNESLSYFKNNFNEKSYLKAIDYILNSKNIYILGVGSSGFLAQDFSMKLARFGFNTKAINDNDFMIMQSAISSKKDLFIAISSQGMTNSIIKALKQCKNNQIKTILITEQIGSQASLYASLTLLAPYINDSSFIVSNQFSQLLVCDVILYYLTNNNSEYLNKYNKTLEVYNDIIKS